MALYNAHTLKSGLASDSTVWFVALQATPTVQVAGAVPNNTATDQYRVLIGAGHTATLDGAYAWGDDSTATITINAVSTANSITTNGTLAAARSVTSSLTVRGKITASSTTGGFDFGTEADPIPASISFTMILNDSAVMASNKYPIAMNPSVFRAWGAYKKPVSQITSVISQSSFIVADATGWGVGDWVYASATAIGPATTEARAIQSITAGTGTTATVVLTAALVNANFVGRYIANVSRNVRWTYSQPAAYQSSSNISLPTTAVANSCEVGYLEVQGGRSIFNAAGLNLVVNRPAQHKKVIGISGHDIVSISGATVVTTPLIAAAAQGYTFACSARKPNYIEDLTICQIIPAAGLTSMANQFRLKNPVALGCNYLTSGVPAVGNCAGGEIVNPTLIGGAVALTGNNAAPLSIVGGVIDGVSVMTSSNSFSCPNCTLQGVSIGQTLGMNGTFLVDMQAGAAVTFEGCTIPAGVAQQRASQDWQSTNGGDYFKSAILSRNNDPTSQDSVSSAGKLWRENSLVYRGTSCLRLEPWYASVGLTYSINVPLSANQTATFIGATRWNASYGAGTPPMVSISGGGVTPASYTNSSAVDTWQEYSLTVTNPNAYPVITTITYTAETAGSVATAFAYFDGIYDSPWITSSRHYGYQFLPRPYVVVDAVAQLSESAANALTGLAIDYATSTLTISGSRTLREIYDYIHAQLCDTANLAQPEFFTSADGSNFNCTFNVVLTGAVTGAGAISMPAKTLTASGTSSASITHSAGVFTSIAVSNIFAGSRVQVYDVTAGSELYNGVPGTSLALALNWAANHTIRTRVTYCSGLTAKLPWTQTGVLTSSGLGVLVGQEDDTVYASNAVDGAAVTEFTPDYNNVQVDVSDGDGVTTAQRLYAWMTHNSTLPAGIAAYFEAVQADDAVNYKIAVALLDLHIQNTGGNAVIITGARLYRDNGTSIFAPGNGPIQIEPAKAYVSSAIGSEVAAAVWATVL